MKKYMLKLECHSPSLIGSGEGFGAIIDTDIVFDDAGIPYIPAKRIKGCLRDAALEVQEMFRSAQISFPIQVEKTFGESGETHSAPVYFSNLTIKNYKENKEWLEYYLKKPEYQDILSRDRILETFTDVRQQTAIDPKDGVADEHSLRTIRVLKTGMRFFGEVLLESNDEQLRNTLLLTCFNLRHIGTKRNRGFGEVRCSLLDGAREIGISKQLEEICIG